MSETETGPHVERPILDRVISAMLQDVSGNPEFDAEALAALRQLVEQGRLSSVNAVTSALTPAGTSP